MCMLYPAALPLNMWGGGGFVHTDIVFIHTPQYVRMCIEIDHNRFKRVTVCHIDDPVKCKDIPSLWRTCKNTFEIQFSPIHYFISHRYNANVAICICILYFILSTSLIIYL